MNVHYFDPRATRQAQPFTAILRRVAFPLDRKLPEAVGRALQRLGR